MMMSVTDSGLTPASATASAGVTKSAGFHWVTNFSWWNPASTSTVRPLPRSTHTIIAMSSLRVVSAPATSAATGKFLMVAYRTAETDHWASRGDTKARSAISSWRMSGAPEGSEDRVLDSLGSPGRPVHRDPDAPARHQQLVILRSTDFHEPFAG